MFTSNIHSHFIHMFTVYITDLVCFDGYARTVILITDWLQVTLTLIMNSCYWNLHFWFIVYRWWIHTYLINKDFITEKKIISLNFDKNQLILLPLFIDRVVWFVFHSLHTIYFWRNYLKFSFNEWFAPWVYSTNYKLFGCIQVIAFENFVVLFEYFFLFILLLFCIYLANE